MSRTNLSFIEQVLSKTSSPVTIDFIHSQCEVVAGRPLSRQTIKRELSRITCEESFKFSWIKRSAKGLYEYVSQDIRSVENFSINESGVSEELIAKVEAVDKAAANFLRSKDVTKIRGFKLNRDLGGLFIWSGSHQGHKYWENISQTINQTQKFVASQSDKLTITIPKHIKKLEIIIE